MSLQAAASGDYFIRTSGGFISPNVMSVCFWVNRNATNVGARAIFGIRDSSNPTGYIYYYSIVGDGTSFGWEHDNGSVTNIDVITMTIGTWYFIALSRSGTGSNQTTVYHRAASDTSLSSTTTT